MELEIIAALEHLQSVLTPDYIFVVKPDGNKAPRLILAHTGPSGTMDCDCVPANDWGGQTLDPAYRVHTTKIRVQIGVFSDEP